MKRLISVTATLVALSLLLLIMGSDGAVCVPIEPEESICIDPLDCEGLPHVACVGEWACQEGTCSWQCEEDVVAGCGDGPGCEQGEMCQNGQCVLGCYGDQDCPEYHSCNAAEVCLGPPGCDPGGICPAVCYGWCEPAKEEPVQCVVSGCSGEICAPEPMASVCIWLEWYECLQFTVCGAFGENNTCAWKETPAYLDCLTNL